jgi:ABC-type transport system substrate-binding protein
VRLTPVIQSAHPGGFMRFAAVLAAAVCLSACGGAVTERSTFMDRVPPPEEPLVMKTGEVGRYGGRFVVANNTAPQTFNPITALTLYSMDVNDRLFTRLAPLRLDTQQEGEGLASSWDVAEDGLSVTFHLRHGAFFSDGHPITAEDVLFSASVIENDKITARDRDMLMMDGQPFVFSAPDPYTVVVRAPHPNGSVLAMVDAVFVLPKHVLEPAVQNGTFMAAYAPTRRRINSSPADHGI